MPSEECYCQMLGINPFKESEYSEDRIESIIKKAVDKWKRDFDGIDETVRFRASRYLDMQSDISDAMLGTESRKAEFDKGRKKLKSDLTPLLKACVITEDERKYAFPKAINEILAKIRWDCITSADVPQILGLEKGRPDPAANADVTNAFGYLKNVNAYTPVEVLNTLISNPKLNIQCHRLTDSSDASSIKAAIVACLERLAHVKSVDFPELNIYLECLRRMNALSEEDMRTLMRYGRCYRDLDDAMESLKNECGYVGRDQIDEMLPSDIDLDMAIPILQNYCFTRAIGANFSRTETKLVRCPHCRSLLSGSEETLVCPNCGCTIRARCRKCNTLQDSRNKVCISCGFNFQLDTDKAKRLAISFRTNIMNGNIAAAKADLTSLKVSYSEIVRVSTLQTEYDACVEKTGYYAGVAKKAFENGRYYATLRALSELRKAYPNILDCNPELASIDRSAKECYDLAQQACAEASRATTEEKKLELYAKAADSCMDHPEAREFLRKYPPQNITNCEAEPTTNGTVMIKFTPVDDPKGVTYCIYRSTRFISVNEDTDPLEVVSRHKAETGYEDKTVKSGVKYHYILCARRWGILSRPKKHIGPIVAFKNVTKVTFNPIDDGFHITFERPEGAHAVRISRCLREDTENCTDIEVGDRNECDDYFLVGNVYLYYFKTEYLVDGVVESSP